MAKNKKDDSVLIMKSAKGFFGLDYLHITLIVLVLILVALAFTLSHYTPGSVLQNCNYGSLANGTCATPQHNSSDALGAAERVLASYATVNSSLSLLTYYSLVNQSKVSYLMNQSKWLVTIPYIDPLANNQTYYTSMIFYDSNLSLAQIYIQTLKPYTSTQNKVVGLGVIGIHGQTGCVASTPFPAYTFLDPYAPGAMQSLFSTINATNKYSSSLNMTYKFIFTGYAASHYGAYGPGDTQVLGADLFCASQQPSFPAYVSNLSKVFVGNPIDNVTLQSIASSSSLNITEFNSCLNNSTNILEHQAQLAALYNITTTPAYVLNCQYVAIPQTLNEAINYTIRSLGK